MTEPDRFELHALAEQHGYLAKQLDAGDSPYAWQHRVADSVHGWTLHNYHYQADPVMLSADEYKAAIDAAINGAEKHEAAIVKPPSRDELDARIKLQQDAVKKAHAEKKKAEETADTAEADPESAEGK